jgi:CarD family transcriptional regulator
VTFQVGDKVIYPNHGLGVVERIENKAIAGTTYGFYRLRMVANDTTVLVPVNNVDGVGLRPAVDGNEIDKLFSLLSDGRLDSHQNWKGRFKDNSDRMRSGSIYDVVEVLKSLTSLARTKTLSFREKRMLDRAKFLVVSEIAEVSHEATGIIEAKVDSALEITLQVRKAMAVKGANGNGNGNGNGHAVAPVTAAKPAAIPPVLAAAKSPAKPAAVRRPAARA